MITMNDFIAAARQGGDIVFTDETRTRVRGTGNRPDNQEGPQNLQRGLDREIRWSPKLVLARALKKAYEDKYRYVRGNGDVVHFIHSYFCSIESDPRK